MPAIRTQYVTQTLASITAGPAVTTNVDIVRPESPAGTPFAENSDWVIKGRQDLQNEAGMVVMELPATLAIAALLLHQVEVWQSYYPAQTGLGSALFPSGATPPSNGQPTLVRTVFTSVAGLAMNAASIPAILGGPLTAPVFPGIELLHGQYVRLVIENTAGLVTGTIQAKYDLGVNAVEYRKL